MAAGHVALEAVLEPDHLADAETVGQHASRCQPRSEAGIALRIEHRRRAHQCRALAVDVHGAALEHDRRDKARHLEARADRLRRAGRPGRMAASSRRSRCTASRRPPERPAWSSTKVGRDIADPGIVVLQRQHRDPLAAVQRGLGGELRARDHGHRLERGDRLGDLGAGLARRRHALAPQLGAAGPGHPAPLCGAHSGGMANPGARGVVTGRPPPRLAATSAVHSTPPVVDPLQGAWRVAPRRAIVRRDHADTGRAE